MKRLIIYIAFFLCSIHCFGQDHVEGYVEWDSLRPDIIKYLNINFYHNREQYTGKKLSTLFNDIELPFYWKIGVMHFFDFYDHKKYPEGHVYALIYLRIEDPGYNDRMMAYTVWHDQDPDMIKPEPYYEFSIKYMPVSSIEGVRYISGDRAFTPYNAETIPPAIGDRIITGFNRYLIPIVYDANGEVLERIIPYPPSRKKRR